MAEWTLNPQTIEKSMEKEKEKRKKPKMDIQ